MDSTVVAGIIGAIGAVVAAVLTAIFARSEFVDALLRKNKFLRIVGKWESTWEDIDVGGPTTGRESLVIETQRGSKVLGFIEMESEPDKRWNFEGNFNGRFLQLMYYPSDRVDALFLDYGCYFFELQGDGTFAGYSIGFSWDQNKTGASTHKLRRVR